MPKKPITFVNTRTRDGLVDTQMSPSVRFQSNNHFSLPSPKPAARSLEFSNAKLNHMFAQENQFAKQDKQTSVSRAFLFISCNPTSNLDVSKGRQGRRYIHMNFLLDCLLKNLISSLSFIRISGPETAIESCSIPSRVGKYLLLENGMANCCANVFILYFRKKIVSHLSVSFRAANV